jgi:hypothetical protein
LDWLRVTRRVAMIVSTNGYVRVTPNGRVEFNVDEFSWRYIGRVSHMEDLEYLLEGLEDILDKLE